MTGAGIGEPRQGLRGREGGVGGQRFQGRFRGDAAESSEGGGLAERRCASCDGTEQVVATCA